MSVARDPRRSLLIGSFIAACVLAALAGLVIIGIVATFSVRRDSKGLGPAPGPPPVVAHDWFAPSVTA